MKGLASRLQLVNNIKSEFNWRSINDKKTRFPSENDYHTGCQNLSHSINNSPFRLRVCTYLDDYIQLTHGSWVQTIYNAVILLNIVDYVDYVRTYVIMLLHYSTTELEAHEDA